MQILRSMPDLSTAAARSAFRQQTALTGAFACIWARRAVYEPHAEQLSVKAAFSGREVYIVDGVRLAVDDDVYLVINQGHEYSSHLASEHPVQSVAVVFSEPMRLSVLRYLHDAREELPPDTQDWSMRTFDFRENLRPHDRFVSPVLKFLTRMCDRGVDDEQWYEEHAHFLLERLLLSESADRNRIEQLVFAKRATREEAARRIGRATDYILTCYAQPITLARLAAVACLARHHFLRTFKLVHGVTPFCFLTCKRVAVAARLLQQSNLPVAEIARVSGFETRSRLGRAFHDLLQLHPAQFRRLKEKTRAGDSSMPRTDLAHLLRGCNAHEPSSSMGEPLSA